MFLVDEVAADAIRRALDEGGEWSAVVELRRHYPAITDNTKARMCVRIIAGWRPIPVLPKNGSRKVHKKTLAGCARGTGRLMKRHHHRR
jgi:hypothetical protein